MYFDEVEVTNILGSKTKIHELGIFCYTFQNLPHKFNSSLSNIHLLAIVNSCEIKKYGFDKVLKPFLEELAQLESEKGLALDDGNRVRGTIASVIGDILAAHKLFGFQSPSSTYFCQLMFICCLLLSKAPTYFILFLSIVLSKT